VKGIGVTHAGVPHGAESVEGLRRKSCGAFPLLLAVRTVCALHSVSARAGGALNKTIAVSFAPTGQAGSFVERDQTA
jgi:hypothetical protein